MIDIRVPERGDLFVEHRLPDSTLNPLWWWSAPAIWLALLNLAAVKELASAAPNVAQLLAVILLSVVSGMTLSGLVWFSGFVLAWPGILLARGLWFIFQTAKPNDLPPVRVLVETPPASAQLRGLGARRRRDLVRPSMLRWVACCASAVAWNRPDSTLDVIAALAWLPVVIQAVSRCFEAVSVRPIDRNWAPMWFLVYGVTTFARLAGAIFRSNLRGGNGDLKQLADATLLPVWITKTLRRLTTSAYILVARSRVGLATALVIGQHILAAGGLLFASTLLLSHILRVMVAPANLPSSKSVLVGLALFGVGNASMPDLPDVLEAVLSLFGWFMLAAWVGPLPELFTDSRQAYLSALDGNRQTIGRLALAVKRQLLTLLGFADTARAGSGTHKPT